MHQLTTLQSSFWSMTSHPRAVDDCLGISPSFKKRRLAHCYMKYCLMKSQRNSLVTVPTHTLTEPMLQGLTITNLPSGLRNSWNNSPWMNILSAIPLISPMSFAICLMTFWSFMTLLLSSSMYNNIIGENYEHPSQQSLHRWLVQQRLQPQTSKELAHQTLELATTNQLLQFDGLLFEQTDGVAMGPPLGHLMANVFMCHLEEQSVQDGLMP